MPASLTLNAPLIEHLLKERGWTRARLARELGIDRSTVSNYLGNPPTGPSGLSVVRLQALFPEHVSELFISHREAVVTTSVAVAAGDEVVA